MCVARPMVDVSPGAQVSGTGDCTHQSQAKTQSWTYVAYTYMTYVYV